MILKFLKSKAIYIQILLAISLISIISIQHLKMNNMTLQLSVIGENLETANNTVGKLSSSIDILNTSVAKYTEEIQQSNINYAEFKYDLQKLKESNTDVKEYLSTTIPDDLNNRLRERYSKDRNSSKISP